MSPVMPFSMTAEYALRAVTELARSPGTLNAEEIASRTLVPSAYLAKILRQMQAAGLVESTRGKTGGWSLSPTRSHNMTVYDVVVAVDQIVRIRECPIYLKEHSPNLCPLHAALDAAFEKLENTFKELRVLDLTDTTVTVDALVVGLARFRKIRDARRGRTSAEHRAKVAAVAKKAAKRPASR